ncbi:glyoxalase [Serinicoccus sp. CNJ-927]|uniref:VOC family protein n=1 Tax=Serinicoccus sp. CNJ-927 TaxID=1904970 RepID=UPI00095920D0|nr:VOC family protein [Serinicoccus sp. CNJ-927]OLT42135.1 glyoxalase [Serinicoccus sp. CNJ-927]
MQNVVHHIELWTTDVEASAPSFDWLLSTIGWIPERDPTWAAGRTWQHASGAYVVLEQSPDVSGTHERTRAGLNHLALRVAGREQLDHVREPASRHGWRELFGELYPHAGGPDHAALFLENTEGFEFELVAD